MALAIAFALAAPVLVLVLAALLWPLPWAGRHGRSLAQTEALALAGPGLGGDGPALAPAQCGLQGERKGGGEYKH